MIPETGDRFTDRISLILGDPAAMTKKQARKALARQDAQRKGWFTANASALNDSHVLDSRDAALPEHKSADFEVASGGGSLHGFVFGAGDPVVKIPPGHAFGLLCQRAACVGNRETKRL